MKMAGRSSLLFFLLILSACGSGDQEYINGRKEAARLLAAKGQYVITWTSNGTSKNTGDNIFTCDCGVPDDEVLAIVIKPVSGGNTDHLCFDRTNKQLVELAALREGAKVSLEYIDNRTQEHCDRGAFIKVYVLK